MTDSAIHYHNRAPAEKLHQLDCPGILKVIKNWPEKILEYHHSEEDSLRNKPSENEKKYALFTDCSATL